MASREVLCALENRDLSRIFDKALRGEGYDVAVVHDGEQAARMIEEAEPALLIADISLSKRDGFELVESARSDGGRMLPVMLLSDARIGPHTQERADSLGVECLLSKPVPLDGLVAHVAELIQRRKPAARRAPAPTSPESVRRRPARSGEGARAMAGSFAEIPFPRLMHQLHGGRATGVLMVSNGRKRKAIELRKGVPIAIKSNLIQECLGNILVRNGTLSEEQHEESLARMKRGEGLQGAILVAMELVDEETITDALRDQAHEKLLEVFEWERGSFRFERGRRIMRANAIALSASPANLILEGVRHRYPIRAVDDYLASHGAHFIEPAKNAFHRFQEIDLDEDERSLAERLDGLHPLEKYATASEATRRALFGLFATGMFRLQPQQGAANARPRIAVSSANRVASRSDALLRAEVAELAENLRGKNHFEVLGVSQSSTEEELEAAYSQFARRVHPDRFQTTSLAVREMACEVMERIDLAFETLRDTRQRQQYVLELGMGSRRGEEDQTNRCALAAESAFQKGQALVQRRAYESALVEFGRALEGRPQDGEYHAHYGWCLYLCHQDSTPMVEEAIEHVKRGASMATDREQPFLFLGRLYKVVGRVVAAEKMFTRAVQIQPECVEALRELRLINLRREKSRGLFNRLLRR